MLKLFNNLSFIIRTTYNIQRYAQVRTLYSPAALGIDGYIMTREKINNQFMNNQDKFREKMKEFIENKSSIIFTEDLRNMIHLANKNDIDLIMKMIQKYHTQNKEIIFGCFVFGPVIMRMFYYLGDVDSALKCINNEEISEFFNQTTTYHILFDMLYENKRYNDILKIFDNIKKNPTQNLRAYRHAVTLVFAACYKMNTPESFEYCLKLWNEFKKNDFKPMRRTATFAAGLALKQNSPHIALEIVSVLKEQQYITIRNIKTQAYAELNRPEDSLPILRSVLETDDATTIKKQTFIRDVINKVKESIEQNHRNDLLNDFNRIEKFLDDNGHITDQTMDDVLCVEITNTSFNSPKRNQGYLAATFSKSNYNRSKNPPRRQGLQDLY